MPESAPGSAPCTLTPEFVRLFLDDALPAPVAAGFMAHAEHCPRCLATMADLDEGVTPVAPSGRPAAPTAVPLQIDGYQIEGELGRGGMGVVYRAVRIGMDRPVAIKVLLGAGEAPAARDRFRREAQALARLDHPGVVKIHDYGFAGVGPYLVLEFIPGSTLGRSLASYRDFRAAAGLVVGLAEGIAAAHRVGIIHRDLKPDNVLIAADGSPRIADFGIAKLQASDDAPAPNLTGTGFLGTPDWTSPEQAAGRPNVDGRADVHALGAILYATLTGRPPFSGGGMVDVLNAVRTAPPTPPSRFRRDCPRDLEIITLKALEKDPGRRYDTAAAMADDLRLFLDDRPISARRVGRVEHLRRWAGRNPIVATLATGLAGTLLAGVLVASSLAVQSRARAQVAEARYQLVQRFVDEVVAAYDETGPGETPHIPQAVRAALGDARALYRDVIAGLGDQDDAAAQVEGARIHRRIGDINRLLDGDPTAALGEYALARREQEARVQADPVARTDRRELGATLHNLGSLQLRQKRMDVAGQTLDQALAVRQALAGEKPADVEIRRELARTRNALGDVHHDAGRSPQALMEYRAALAILHALVDGNPQATEDRYALLNAEDRLAQVLVEYRDLPRAQAVLRDALRDGEILVAARPDVTEYHLTLAQIALDLGASLLQAGDLAGAEAAYAKAVGHFETLAREPSRRNQYQREADDAAANSEPVAVAYRDRALEEANRGDFAPARTDYDHYARIVHGRIRDLTRRGRTDEVAPYHEGLGEADLELGLAYQGAGQLDQAETLYKKAVRSYEALAAGPGLHERFQPLADGAADNFNGLAAAYRDRADQELTDRKFADAAGDYRACARLLREQVARGGVDVAKRRETLALMLINWAARLWQLERSGESKLPLREALDLEVGLVSADPASQSHQANLLQTTQALVQLAQKDADWKAVAQLWRRMVEAESAGLKRAPGEVPVQNYLRSAGTLWLGALIRADESEPLAQGAEAMVAALPDDPTMAFTAACALAQAVRLADGDPSLAGDRRAARGDDYAGRALELLRRSIARHFDDQGRGYDPAELADEASLAPLRGRADFEAFQAHRREQAKDAPKPLARFRSNQLGQPAAPPL